MIRLLVVPDNFGALYYLYKDKIKTSACLNGFNHRVPFDPFKYMRIRLSLPYCFEYIMKSSKGTKINKDIILTQK